MANGLVINGVVQPLGFGLGMVGRHEVAAAGSLGNVPPFAARSVATWWGGTVSRGGWGRKVHAQQVAAMARQSLCIDGQLIPTVGAQTRVQQAMTCGMPGAMACNYSSPQSALNGLGDVSNWSCSDWAAVMTQMQTLLAKAEEMGLSSAVEYQTAKNYFDSTSGPFQKPIFTCGSATETAKQFYSDLNRVVGGGPALSDIIGANAQSGDKVLTAIKWGTVALAVVAGAYALGPILRGAGSLIHPRRR